MNLRRLLGAVLLGCIGLGTGMNVFGIDYYLDALTGDDENTGLSSEQAWASLAKASSQDYAPGDRIFLKRGETFEGKLKLTGVTGTSSAWIEMLPYGDGEERPVIDAAGYLAGVHLSACQYVSVRGLEITANGGETVDDSNRGLRYGLLIDAPENTEYGSIYASDLTIHHIFPEIDTEHEGRNPTTFMGTGIRMAGTSSGVGSNIRIENCDIRTVGYKAIEMKWLEQVEVLNNYMEDIGGPAMQPSRVNDLLVRGNTVNGSGQYSDERMHGRGSGIWPWGSERVTIERNQFMHARGRYDSCGAHIDFNCRDVVVQYNLSIDNAGGFVEILGNNHNCAYRYNISIGDGHRIEGEDGANANGHIFWTSGFVGHNNDPHGPYNCYIYNNTIYTSEEQLAGFRIQYLTRGLLIANNVFYIEGTSYNEEKNAWDQDALDSVIWKNNLYQKTGVLPDDLPFAEIDAMVADPGFVHPGSLDPEDYRPYLFENVKDKGIAIETLPGDSVGLLIGLDVTEDYFGNPIVGMPDLGAIETGDALPPLPNQASFINEPEANGVGRIDMEAIRVFDSSVEYKFTEMTGNPGGSSSDWQASRHYTDEGLIPNTDYAYYIEMRDADGTLVSESEVSVVKSAEVFPYLTEALWQEHFLLHHFTGNTIAPFPANSWHMNRQNPWERDDGNGNSVAITGGRLRLGWGFDAVMLRYFLDQLWNTSENYRFSGDWYLMNVLEFHDGFIAGIGIFDVETGDLLHRMKEQGVGVTAEPEVGQSGRFQVELSSDEVQAWSPGANHYVGIYFIHDDGGTLYEEGDTRNDVYEVDNLRVEHPSEDEDLDLDGMPDTFENQYGLDPEVALDATQDLDEDGLTNLIEQRIGSNPTIADTHHPFSGTITAGVNSITLPEAYIHSGRIYILEYETGDGYWKVIANYQPIESESGDFVFSLPAGQREADYRIRVEWSLPI